MTKIKFSKEEAYKASLLYFKGDTLATDVFLSKYALKDLEGNFLELTPDDMHKRLAHEFNYVESKYPNPINYKEIYELLKDFKYVIPGGSNLYGMGNNHRLSSLGNCFVVGNKADSYGGIFQTDQEQTQLMKYRAGVGHDISHYRPKGVVVSNTAGTSVGIVPLMERFSNSTREVSQNGRRGALMLSIDVNHPDIVDFIKAKEDLTKVTGANVSVKINKEFMDAVNNNNDYMLTFPTNMKIPLGEYYEDTISNLKYGELTEIKEVYDNSDKFFKKGYLRLVKAREIWDLMMYHAWKSAEPGILFWNNIIKESPADLYEGFETISTNPCLSGDTWVTTEGGPQQIKDLVGKGKLKLLKDGKFYETTDEGFFHTGYKPIYELVLENGYKIKATNNHKFLYLDEVVPLWVELKNLKVGESLALSNNNNLPYIPTSKIKSITYLNEEDVYDCTVPEVSSFDANGIIVHNCGEIPLCPYDSCRLLSINLFGFIENPFTDFSYFNIEKFEEVAYISQKLMDDIVDLEIEKVNKILHKLENDNEPNYIKNTEINLWKNILQKLEIGRRTGLSVIGVGDALAALNLKYDSEKAIEFTEHIYKTLALESYKSSIDMARDRRKFPIQSNVKEKHHPFIERVLKNLPPNVIENYNKYGRRNIANLTIPPSGSLAILAGITSGIEPVFSLYYTRRRKVEKDHHKIDFVDQNGDCWEEYNVVHPKLKMWYGINYGKDIQPIESLSKIQLHKAIEQSPYYKASANEIDYIQKVKMQGKIQKWIDHSISVTHNLPKTISQEEVSNIYKMAYEWGCKGCTIYRDGSRTGVLVNEDEKKKENFKLHDAFQRPKEVICDIHKITSKGENYIVLVGLVEDLPYEVFCLKQNGYDVPKIKKGWLKKIKKGHYNLLSPSKEVLIENITSHFDRPVEEAITRLVSMNLRHGASIKFIVEQLQKSPTEINDFSKVIARTIKKYIKDGEKAGENLCPSCGGENTLIYQDGCVTCMACPYSKC